MQKHKSIKALFLLGIFSMLLLHQIVPHWHHQHQEGHHEKNVVLHHDHTHNHDHGHDHDNPEEDDSKKGFIDWFLKMHLHTNATTDVLVLHETFVKKIDVKKELVKKAPNTQFKVDFFEEPQSIRVWYDPPDRNQSSHVPYLKLRGPPSLG